jgi:STE24 endopeptidase
MTPQQIEAVFGHEAGHVRHRHMQHFLAFSFVGWLFVAALMEGLAHLSRNGAPTGGLSLSTIEAVGIVATVLFWGIGFGWVSRRFERQADLFGARCVTPDDGGCAGPCSVHGDRDGSASEAHSDGSLSPPLPRGDELAPLSPGTGGARRGFTDGRVCSTGTAIFASALDRVATLNGIPREEYSWRHSSIASRIRSLAALAGDPRTALQFDRRLRRLQTGLWIVAIVGAAACIGYWIAVPEPAILQLQAVAR